MAFKIVIVLLFCLFSELAFAYCKTATCVYNPHPSSDDFILPLPNHLQMVFKKVIVEGSEFWGNEARVVKLGDVSGNSGEDAMFEGVRRVPAAGAFYDWQQKNWYYLLGKYEVSIGQYIAVMGEGDKNKGLQHFYQYSGDSRFIGQLKKAFDKGRDRKIWQLLARPLTAMNWFDYQHFIRTYNHWCYKKQNCLAKLPRLPRCLKNESRCKQVDNLPGFFRLPTELEWEYAARGGVEALSKKHRSGQTLFEQVLPFDRNEAKQYAWLSTESRGKGATIIGRKAATYGFYDLFGNVQELTANLFAAEGIQGKVGALTVRGGSYYDSDQKIRASLRTELDIYQLSSSGEMRETRSQTTGMRLAIGSLVIRDSIYRQSMQDEFDDYQTYVQPDTVVGLSKGNALVQGNSNIQTARDILASAAAGGRLSKQQLRAVQRELTQAEHKMQEHMDDACYRLVSNVLLYAKTAGHNYAQSIPRATLIDKMKQLASSSQRSQRIHMLEEQHKNLMQAFEVNFARYKDNVIELKGYPANIVERAINAQNVKDAIIIQYLRLLKTHLQQGNAWSWMVDIQKLAVQI